VPEVAPGVRCPTGQARITPSFGRLQVRYVIHTVGPVYRNPGESGPLLGSAYRSSLACARGQGLTSIAFPAISCGVYGYPLAEAADLAVSTCREHAGELEKVAFILFSAEVWEQWLAAAERQLP
jgi:O-acetyl-ADP-ribose deacetylase (regulator of RNase III)